MPQYFLNAKTHLHNESTYRLNEQHNSLMSHNIFPNEPPHLPNEPHYLQNEPPHIPNEPPHLPNEPQYLLNEHNHL